MIEEIIARKRYWKNKNWLFRGTIRIYILLYQQIAKNFSLGSIR